MSHDCHAMRPLARSFLGGARCQRVDRCALRRGKGVLRQRAVDPRLLGLQELPGPFGRVLIIKEDAAPSARVWLWVADRTDHRDFDRDDEEQALLLAMHVQLAYEKAALYRRVAATESLYRTLVEQIPAVIYYRSLEMPGTPSFVSPQVESLFGFSPTEAIEDPDFWQKRIHPDDRERVLGHQQAFLPAEQGSPIRVEYRAVRKDGKIIWVHNYALAVRDEAGRARFVMGAIFDVTEPKKLEEQLRQAQKLDAIGKLAGGVAHDFNNLLTVILTYASLLIEKSAAGDPMRDDLVEILSAGNRARVLTSRLLAFGRQQVLSPRVFDLSETIAGMKEMLRRLLGEDIDLQTRTPEGLRKIKADPHQIEQVILNLAINARDAMPKGGLLTIEAANVDLDAEFPRVQLGVAPGRYVMLAVTDSGVGMDRATQARIFEPFFTTKEQGKGTGLGLSTVFGIAQQSGGTIWFYSEPGRGTTFKVFLPETTELPHSEPPSVREVRHGTETVLVAEDDEQVRRLVLSILRRYGYDVLEAKDAGEALLHCERHQGPIHLLVTDVVMPHMSGRELADRLAAIRPDLNVLFMSGYTEDAILRHGIASTAVSFVQKPFTAIELAKKVRAVLDSGGA